MDYGIDISNHQQLIDPAAVKANGITFAYLKASEGTTFADQTVHDFARRLSAVGIKVGVYHFARAGDARQQARFFKSVAGDLMQTGNLRPVLDIECDGLNQDTWHNAFHDELGLPSMVYGSLSWFQNLDINPNGWGARDCLAWVAQYNGAPGKLSFLPPRAVLHQHTDGGNVPGVPGPVDRNATIGNYTLGNLVLGGAVAPTPPSKPAQTAPTPPAPITTLANTPAGGTYVVKAGDTVSAIAAAWKVSVAAIQAANPYIKNPNYLNVGDKVKRPAVASAPAVRIYIVKSGDSLSGIAAKLGVTVDYLRSKNSYITNPNFLNIGDRISY